MNNARNRGGKRRLGIATTLLALALALGLLAAGPASAASRGFKLENHADVALKLDQAKAVPTVVCGNSGHCVQTHYPMDFEGRPANGSTIAPGGAQTWELKYGFSLFGGVQYAAELWYDIAGTNATVQYTIEVWSTTNESQCKVHGSSKYTCTAQGTKLTFKG